MITLTPKEIPAIQPAAIDAAESQIIDPLITLTDGARAQIKRALARKLQTEPGTFLRIGVKGGGCSGMSYLMEPDTEFDERDRTWVTEDGIRVVIDAKSIEFLTGTTIDYDIKNLMEGGYVWNNPNAARSCGCGTSFTPK